MKNLLKMSDLSPAELTHIQDEAARLKADCKAGRTEPLLAGNSVALLFSKAVLDGSTALIFASTLGKSICAIPLPQCVILLCVFGAGRLLAGVLTPPMFADLSACGGVLTMAEGFRVSKLKSVPLVDLMPALLLVMPISLLWTMQMG